jgi:hypothetical protein
MQSYPNVRILHLLELYDWKAPGLEHGISQGSLVASQENEGNKPRKLPSLLTFGYDKSYIRANSVFSTPIHCCKHKQRPAGDPEYAFHVTSMLPVP